MDYTVDISNLVHELIVIYNNVTQLQNYLLSNVNNINVLQNNIEPLSAILKNPVNINSEVESLLQLSLHRDISLVGNSHLRDLIFL